VRLRAAALSKGVTSLPLAGARGGSPSAALFVSLLGFFVITLDALVVTVALPSIRAELGGGVTGLQWIVDGYTITFAALLLIAGWLSDRAGARRTFAIGLAVFVVASAACAFAPTLGVLIAARVVQGVGASLMLPSSMALIREAYDEPAARARAIALWATGGAVASAAGPLLGGLLTEISWRAIFVINLPVGLLAFLVVILKVAPSPRRTPAAGQLRQARGLFRIRPFRLALAAGFTFMFGFYGMVFLLSLYLHERGLGPFETGLAFLPMTALVAVVNLLAPRIAARLGSARTVATALVIMTAGLAALMAAVALDAPIPVIAAVAVPIGLAGGLGVPTLIAVVLDMAPAERTGLASGILNTARQVGPALSVALFGLLIAAPTGFVPGMLVSLALAAALALVLAAAHLRRQSSPSSSEVPTETESRVAP
jgi:DHA2 family methylenomycin A resistance protein-like MFS transporter